MLAFFTPDCAHPAKLPKKWGIFRVGLRQYRVATSGYSDLRGAKRSPPWLDGPRGAVSYSAHDSPARSIVSRKLHAAAHALQGRARGLMAHSRPLWTGKSGKARTAWWWAGLPGNPWRLRYPSARIFCGSPPISRVPVIAATGAANVADTLNLTEHASAIGVAAPLVLTPIYAKPTTRGLLDYFLRVADVTSRPFLLYQIPSRTNCTAFVDTCRAIADGAPHFIGMKQSTDDREFVRQVIETIGPDFRVFMGTSEIAWDMVGQGASGLIVAIANVIPETTARLCELAAPGEL